MNKFIHNIPFMTADLLFFLFAASRLLLLTLLRLVVRPDNVCTSYDVFSGAALNYYRNNWCLSLRAFFPHSVSKSGTLPGTALTGDRSPKTGTVPGNRGRLVTLPQELVRSCAHMSASKGYSKAKKLL